MPASLDLLLPVGADPFDPAEQRLVRAAVEEGLTDGLWVRDLPLVPVGDPDTGQGGDPFAHLAYLTGAGLDRKVQTMGTASVILGARHPLVVARAVAGLQAMASCPVVLGVGSGGKPAMNKALGIAGRSVDDFARGWRALREALRRPGDAATELVVPDGYRPPDVQLATTDLARWAAVEGDAEGWQTFLSSPQGYLRDLAAISAVRPGPLRVCVRADVRVDETVTGGPHVGERGRVTCRAGQLAPLLRTWLTLPVDHMLLSVRGVDPLRTLRTVRDSF